MSFIRQYKTSRPAVSVEQLLVVGVVFAMLLAASIGQWLLTARAETKPTEAKSAEAVIAEVMEGISSTPQQPDVYTATSELTDVMIGDAVIDHIRKIAIEEGVLNPVTDELSVEIQHIPQGPKQFRHEITADTPVTIKPSDTLHRQFRHQAYIRLALVHAKGETHTMGVPAKITITKPVWVASSQILPGQKLTRQNCKAEKRALTYELTKVLPASEKLTNHVARLMVLEGDTLKHQQVTVPLAVRSQGYVKILMSTSHGVRMMIEGKSLEDGHVGDLIRVRNRVNPDRLYTAKIIAPGRVAVTL